MRRLPNIGKYEALGKISLDIREGWSCCAEIMKAKGDFGILLKRMSQRSLVIDTTRKMSNDAKPV